MMETLRRFVAAFAASFTLSREQFMELLLPTGHSPHIRRHRSALISSRVALVAMIFAVATPLWIIVDALVFPWPVWGVLALLRMGSALVFLALAWPQEERRSLRTSLMYLAVLLAVPPVFYLIAQPFLLGVERKGLVLITVNAYALLPVIAVAGLSIFPLTALEVVLFSAPILAVSLIGALQHTGLPVETFVTTLWLMVLVMGVAVFSGMSQLNYMIALINQAAHDMLTGAFTRRSGEEAIDLQFRISVRTGTPLTIGFIDLDRFKTVNDDYGHEEGDRILREAADSLRGLLRRSDVLIRWGGEEFVLLLPNTDRRGVDVIIERLRVQGLGLRPEGTPLTASIGFAERTADGADDWEVLIEKADARMYRAKNTGRNRALGIGDHEYGESLIGAAEGPGRGSESQGAQG